MSAAKGKKPNTARWGWNGTGIISLPVMATLNECDTLAPITPNLRSIAERLARTPTDIQRIEAELMSLRPRYHRYLRQDEFGPGRVEQLIALRDLACSVDCSIDLLNAMPSPLLDHLSMEVERIERFSRPAWFDDAAVRALALAADRLVRKSELHQLDQSYVGLLQNLASTLRDLLTRISLLDTNSQVSWLLAAGYQKRSEPNAPANTTAAQSLSRLKLQLHATINKLESTRGPDPQKSLAWLVTCLCDLWRQETGRGVESMGWVSGDFEGRPHSKAARFVSSVVEAFQPEQSWFEEQLPAYTSTQLIFAGTANHRARARRIQYLIRDYVRRQPQDAVPRRRPRQEPRGL